MKKSLTAALLTATFASGGAVATVATSPAADAASYRWYAVYSRGVHNSCKPTLAKIRNGHHNDVRWTGRSVGHKNQNRNWCGVWYRATTPFAGSNGATSTSAPPLYARYPQRIDHVRFND